MTLLCKSAMSKVGKQIKQDKNRGEKASAKRITLRTALGETMPECLTQGHKSKRYTNQL